MSKKDITSLQETYTLPSNGKLDNIEPEFTIRSMTTQEEKIRLGSTGRFFKTMSTIIDQCIVSPEGFNSYELTLNDFVYLLYKLRTVSYGNNYKVEVKCSDCEHIFKDTIDLDSLKVITLPDDFTEPFSIGKLPRCGDEIGLRLLRAKEIDEISREAEIIKKKYPNNKGDETYTLKLRKQILTINGAVPSDAVKEKYVQDMLALDSQYINNKYDKVELGLDLSVSSVCPNCGAVVEYVLPIGDEFFRPSFD